MMCWDFLTWWVRATGMSVKDPILGSPKRTIICCQNWAEGMTSKNCTENSLNLLIPRIYKKLSPPSWQFASWGTLFSAWVHEAISQLLMMLRLRHNSSMYLWLTHTHTKKRRKKVSSRKSVTLVKMHAPWVSPSDTPINMSEDSQVKSHW